MSPTDRHDPVLRALMLFTATGATSLGLTFSLTALYLTRVAGIATRTVGVGLTLAGILAVVATFVAGQLSDRYGARPAMIGAALTQALALIGYCLLDGDVVTFVLLACVLLGAAGVQGTAKAALIAQAFPGTARTLARARIRVVTNIFVAAGSGLAAITLVVGTPLAYRIALLTAALLLAGSVLPLLPLKPLKPSGPGTAEIPELTGATAATGAATATALPAAAGPVPVPATAGTSPLHDRRYLALAALNGVLHVQFDLLTLGMPLWVATRTEAPEALIGVLMVLNTVVVTALQIPATRLVTDARAAGRTVFAATGLLALTCVLYPVAGTGGAVLATSVLIVTVAVQSLAEVLSEAGNWELSFELADPARPGAYQGLSQTGAAVGGALAPVAITSSAIAHGLPGWLLLGGVFVSAGAGTRALSRTAPQPVPAGVTGPGVTGSGVTG
ncbi:MFS transporter [Kineosporia sp. J2-2]|uniref:MFS transporter n=1 Tax=Kineosporia corallincola TaxID=2835133 RepID=A0ABS5TBT0_9ACTN|nr:MFS transporter [Kineosporia corallincola]MBT0768547.1 MFS transporter [Kineosporia corallincola]